MKRGFYLLVAVAAVMALTTVSMVAAAKPEGNGKGKPKAEATGPRATGRGSNGAGVTISFEHGIDDSGNYGKLKYTDRESGQKFSGSHAVCYTPGSAGNEAVFGGEIEVSTDPDLLWKYYLVKVVDNGAGKSAILPDQYAIEYRPNLDALLNREPGAPRGSCKPLEPTTEFYDLVKGGIEVTP